jgi:hypothetical protein
MGLRMGTLPPGCGSSAAAQSGASESSPVGNAGEGIRHSRLQPGRHQALPASAWKASGTPGFSLEGIRHSRLQPGRCASRIASVPPERERATTVRSEKMGRLARRSINFEDKQNSGEPRPVSLMTIDGPGASLLLPLLPLVPRDLRISIHGEERPRSTT